MRPPLKVSNLQARRFLRRAHRFDGKLSDVGGALQYHGYIQIDPLNVCGRMHDHILRNRVEGYREGQLSRHLHGDGEKGWILPQDRTAFEHHLPSTGILVAFPLDAWPHLRACMRERTRKISAWSGRLTPREKAFARQILDRFQAAGPLAPEDFADERKGRRVWGAATLAKATLQKLFFHGELLIVGREKNRRLYELPHRVLPEATLALKEHTREETARWLALSRLKQHRLVALKKSEYPLVEDQVEPVSVEGCPRLYCLQSDLSLFEDVPQAADAREPLLLAPLDPMIYDRRVTRALWGFDYAWEVYVPPSKRKRGYYALPILSGMEFVGHVDLKADRNLGRLRVLSRSVRRGHATQGAIGTLARFLGLKAVDRQARGP